MLGEKRGKGRCNNYVKPWNIVVIQVLKMSIKSRFDGKRVLITGTTGFLGKVLLEKILYSLSCVDKIYVLIRGKEGSNLHERFKKEIVSSPCFDRLRNIHKGKFDEFIQTKVQPIQGDLQKEELGFSKETLKEIIENCHIIINCAASIDFNARIDQAIDSNIRGSLRMLELARKVRKLDIFTHISTCYVNCDQRGLIKEEIYEKEDDPEEQIKYLESLPLNELVANTTKILGEYPNTYTYTKNLCQKLMKRRQGDVPVCIVRPAIINTSFLEPFPGWIDSIAAAAALFMFVGLGIVKQLKGNMKKIGDTVPVDVVVATIIVATALNFNTKSLPIYHVGSSDRNPLTWGQIKEEVVKFWNSNVSQSKMGKASVLVTEKEWVLNLRKLQRQIPVNMYLRLSPFLGKQHQKNAQKMSKTISRGEQIAKIFEFFVRNEWIYECRNFKKLWDFLTPEERRQYLIDIADIDIRRYVQINNYGIQKYILKENVELPSQNSNLLSLHNEDDYFADMKWALNTEIPFNRKKVIAEMKTKILSSSRVLKAIESQANKFVEKNKVSLDKAISQTKIEAERLIEQIIGQVKPSVIRTMAWTVHKAFKNVFEKININMEMLEQIREIQQNSDVPIVLLPTHRSYLDFLIISYIFFIYKLRLPNFVADEVLLQAQLLPFLVRSSGAFFFQKHVYDQSRLYHIIFDKYVELLLREGNTLEFFIEGTRSRTGKILAPRFQILNIVLDTLIHGKVPEVCLIPMTVNYEKVLEGDTFPGQLLGEQKVAESLLRVIKAMPQLKINHGRVYVEICKPMMARQFAEEVKKVESSHGRPIEGPKFRQILLEKLGREIIHRMTNGIVIMSTAIVSSVLLMHRKGISEDALIKTVNELAKYILKKGYKVGGVNENSSAVAVRNAIGFLSGITTKTKKNIFQLTISAGDEFQKILMLSYYRNTLTHAFLPQAFIGCVIASFGDQLNTKEGIPLSRIHEQARFLISLLRNEYYIEYSLESYVDFMIIIQQMQDNMILELKGQDKIVISSAGPRMIVFYCSLLRSQIECYWASLVYIITIARSQDHRYQTSSLNKFFDTVQWFMESLYEEKVIEDYEACSLESIKNAFETYQKQKLVKLTAGGKKKESVVEVLVPLEQLEGLENNIKFFRKSVYSSVLSPTEVAKSSLKQLVTLPKL